VAPQAIALLGAECTGKSTLTTALQHALSERGFRSARVDEVLRSWCDAHQRTPFAQEQACIAQAQLAAIEAVTDCDFVLCDTTPLITAVYSDLLFGDDSLYADALQHQRRYALTLLCGTDLPWVADGLQRDGEAARLQFDARLREVLTQQRIAFCTVLGVGEARLQSALRNFDAHVLRQPCAGLDTQAPWRWQCERCSDAACEHRLFRKLVQQDPML
jgi:HTH-type transcriptional repressor of NAD biosynthesis genes